MRTHPERFHVDVDDRNLNYLNSAEFNENGQLVQNCFESFSVLIDILRCSDAEDTNGWATWLFRSRKFCCAPPL